MLFNKNQDIINIITSRNDKYTKGEHGDINISPENNIISDIKTRIPLLKFSCIAQIEQSGNPDSQAKLICDQYDELPYSAIASLKMTSDYPYANSIYTGNGVFVGPRHILTCRHNTVNEFNRWFDEIHVFAGLRVTEAHFGVAKVIAICTFDTDYDNPEQDLALLIIDNPLGKATGWMGMYAFKEDNDILEQGVGLTGYNDSTNFLYSQNGNVKPNGEILEHDFYTNHGSCGSPIWFRNEIGLYFVVGIHVDSREIVKKASRLSLDKFEALLENKTSNSKYKIMKYGEMPSKICQNLKEDFVFFSNILLKLNKIFSKTLKEVKKYLWKRR